MTTSEQVRDETNGMQLEDAKEKAKLKAFNEYGERMRELDGGSVKWTTFAVAFCEGWDAAIAAVGDKK